jgi:hypothetical protein
LAFKDIKRSLEVTRAASTDIEMIALIAAAESVAHHHAVERGLTAGYLGNPTPEGRDNVEAQRKQADNAAAQLMLLLQNDGAYSDRVIKILNPLLGYLDDKEALRREVDSQQGSRAFTFYSSLNASALNAATALTIYVNNLASKEQLSNAILLAQLKERLGQQRGKVNGVIARKEASETVINELKGYQQEAQYISGKLENSLSKDSVAMFTRAMTSNEATLISRTLRSLDSGNIDASVLPSNSEWFGAATSQIKDVKAILDNIWVQVNKNAEDMSL